MLSWDQWVWIGPLLLKHIPYISVLTIENEYFQPSELLMCCDRTIYSNSYKAAWKIRADILFSRHLESVYEVSTSSQVCPDFWRAPEQHWENTLQGSCVPTVSVPLAEPWVLSPTSTKDIISNELHVEAQKKLLHKIFDPPPQKMCFLLLCWAGFYMRVRVCERVDENLYVFHKVDSLACFSTHFFSFTPRHSL